jgi:type IV pilus assembly protein PilM
MVSLGDLFGKKHQSVLGVDIGSSSIKIVQIKKKNGQAVLETYGELALGPYAGSTIGQAAFLPPEKIAQALTDLMKEKEVNITTNLCGISIPFGSSLMFVMELPAVAERQLQTMIPIEARKYVPVPITEVMLDWTVIPKNEVKVDEGPLLEGAAKEAMQGSPTMEKIDVLGVAIHNEVLNRYKDIVTRAGLSASFFEIEIFSTMRAVLDDTLSPVLVMDIGSATTKIYIVERGIVKASHTVNRGSQDITSNIAKSLGITTDKAEVMKRREGLVGSDPAVKEVIGLTLDYIFAEANRVQLTFEKRYNRAVSKVVLIGGGSALKGLAALAKENLKTEAIAANPFQKLSAPAFIEDVLRDTGPEFAVAVGLALRRLGEEE